MAKLSSELGLEPKSYRYTRSRELHAVPKGVQRARFKAQNVQETIDLDSGESRASPLFKRFFSLPQEIRYIIYRQLLVQPCKFDIKHSTPCNSRFSRTRPGPSTIYDGREGPQCANCHPYIWKQPQITIYKSLARSQWMESRFNPFLCDNCYWDLNGARDGIPCMRSLPCLCARRNSLGLLMTSKRFWNDAAPIFWTENWFAFEHPCLLTGFLTAIRPQVRSWLRRICFLPLPAYDYVEHMSIFPSWRDPIWNGWDDIKSCWRLLRQCDGLVELELDVMALTRLEWARMIRQIPVRKRVIFSYHLPEDEQDDAFYEREDPTSWVWGVYSRRYQFESPTTALVASSMLGKVIKSKALGRHYAETTLLQRCGDYGEQFIEDMIEGRMWIHEQSWWFNEQT